MSSVRNNKLWIAVFLAPTLLLFALIYAVPIFTVGITSFFDYSYAKLDFTGFANYAELFSSTLTGREFVQALTNTVLWILLQITLHVALGVFVALGLYRKPFGWKVVRTAYMLPNIVSLAALGIIYLNVFDSRRGLFNGLIRLFGDKSFDTNWYVEHAFMTTTVTWLVFAGLITILILADIASISEDIYESARIDGASGWRMDWYFTLPLVRNTIGTGIILAATSMLKEFELIYMTTNGGPGIATLNLPLLIYKTALIQQNYGLANAVGVITILLGVLLTVGVTRVFLTNRSESA
jgi:raffinose/stachyose/melibiose transport system permease protein